jgi:hypothetical protein
MQKMKSFCLYLLYFLGFSILGISIGFGIGVGLKILYDEGLFTSWKQLDGSLRYTELVKVTYDDIWAKTLDGKVYSWSFNCYREEPCNVWIETNETLENAQNFGQLSKIGNAPCQILDFKLYRKPPRNAVQCGESMIFGVESSLFSYYVLLENGTIWASHFHPSNIFGLVMILFLPVGFILGVRVFIIFVNRRRKTQSN